jgi:hypothetical protein
LECNSVLQLKCFFIATLKIISKNCNPEEHHHRNTKITTSNMTKLTGVAGTFAAVAVEAPLDDALA